jgi:predicted negative regulator of RcsB-dependent stress response
MQAQDAATAYFFKLWSWVEANTKQVAIGAIIVAIAMVLVSYYFWRQNQLEITAGQAFTQLLISIPPNSDAGQLADAYLKIATDYSGTQTGERALVLGATTLFESGKYADAQAQFQKYLDTHPGNTFSAPAALGLAACLDAQGKIDPAAAAYQRVINGFSDPNAVDAAKFALAKIDEQRGKLTDAENLYQAVAHNNPNTPLGSEAAFHAIQLRTKLPSTVSPNSPPTSFNLSTKP